MLQKVLAGSQNGNYQLENTCILAIAEQYPPKLIVSISNLVCVKKFCSKWSEIQVKKPCFYLSAFLEHHLEGHFNFRRIQEQRESSLALLFISFTRRRLAKTYFWEVEILSTPAGITD